MRHIDGVSLHSTFVEGILSEENHPEVVLRNDGSAAIAYQNISLAYGAPYVSDRHHPEGWGLVNLLAWGVLAPGEERRLPRPDGPTGVGIIGPVATVDDAAGQRWYITPDTKVRDGSTSRPPKRRHIWFEKQKWLLARSHKIEVKAARIQARRPGRFPALPLLIDFLWGWRAGAHLNPYGPRNRPLGWRYAYLADWTVPEVPSELSYGWRLAH